MFSANGAAFCMLDNLLYATHQIYLIIIAIKYVFSTIWATYCRGWPLYAAKDFSNIEIHFDTRSSDLYSSIHVTMNLVGRNIFFPSSFSFHSQYGSIQQSKATKSSTKKSKTSPQALKVRSDNILTSRRFRCLLYHRRFTVN